MKRVLCLCQKGNSRSVGCAWVLKMRYHVDALAAGALTQSKETLGMLYDWADVIVVMSMRLVKYVPIAFHAKLVVVDVGTDRYFRGWDHGLTELCEAGLKVKGVV